VAMVIATAPIKVKVFISFLLCDISDLNCYDIRLLRIGTLG